MSLSSLSSRSSSAAICRLRAPLTAALPASHRLGRNERLAPGLGHCDGRSDLLLDVLQLDQPGPHLGELGLGRVILAGSRQRQGAQPGGELRSLGQRGGLAPFQLPDPSPPVRVRRRLGRLGL
jgi:hypothetical protein